MNHSHWRAIARSIAPLILAATSAAQTPVAADVVMAVDNGNGTSNLVSYLGDYSNTPGTWSATLINQEIPGAVTRIAQDSSSGAYFTLSTSGGVSLVQRVESPHMGGYGTLISILPQATPIFSSATLQLTDINFDRSASGLATYGRTLVLLGVGSGGVSLTRIGLGGAVLASTTTPLPVPVNTSASLAIDRQTGVIYVATDSSQIAAVNPNFTLLTPAAPLSPLVIVSNLSWNNTGLGASDVLTVAGVDPATSASVIRRYSTSGASAQAPIYTGPDSLVDLSIDPNGHIYSLRSVSGVRALDRFHTATHASAPPSAPLPPSLINSATAMAFSTRASYYAAQLFFTNFNHTQAVSDSVRIGAALPPGSPFPQLDVTILPLVPTAPPLAGEPTWLHFASAYIIPPVFIPNVGWLGLNVGAPGFFTSAMTPVINDVTTNYRPTARVTIPFTPSAAHNGYVCWVQLQISPAYPMLPPYLADAISSFTVGFEPVE